ncbi:hypothetical protein B0H19DRAFT_1173050 [Mycena capillaripes]|nr:hypothetical protein B0H19DRAFT_1173050 [Mycena capillaripes]
MRFVTVQGLASATFRPPPLNGSLLLPEVLEYNAQHSSEHPLFFYPGKDGVIETLTWSRAIKVFRRAAHISHTRMSVAEEDENPFVVAILVATDQITYLSVIAGLMLAGFIPFPISPRNSDAAVVHLLQSSGASHMFVSADPPMQSLAASAHARLAEIGTHVKLMPLPTFRELFQASPGIPDTRILMKKRQLDDAAVVMHSSGSTAFPKAIRLSHRIMLESGLTPYYGEVDFCGEVISAHAVPVFHMLGLVQLPYAAFTGMGVASFSPSAPPAPPSPDRVFEGAVTTNSTMLITPPSFLEIWAQDPVLVEHMKGLVTVIFGGGPLQPSVGDMLAKRGVNISHLYGMTEGNCLSVLVPKTPAKEGWDYFPVSPHTDPCLVPMDDNPNVFQVFFKKSPTHTPAVLDTNIDGVPALNTKDLIMRHPDNANLWKIFGRNDDQIMHSNGEKTNPVPIEKILHEDPAVRYAIMFGRGNFHAGVIIFPEEPFDPADNQRVIEFRRKIWPAVEEANKIAPTHSRIFKEMVLVGNPAKPIELTVKGTPRRQAVLDAYAKEIEDLYLSVEDSFQKHLTAPVVFDPTSTLEFVRTVVVEVMRQLPGDDEDLFQRGCDSLQATWIRNSILRAAVDSDDVYYKAIPHNFVYSRPTIRLLAGMLVDLAAGRAVTVDRLAAMTLDDPFANPLVEICSGTGTPLIILPGASGSGLRFLGLRKYFQGPLWVLQITEEVPLESLTGLVGFWKQQVQAKRPHGPYRLATFSAGALSGVILAKLFEDQGEQVSQLTFIDNCPALWMRQEAEILLREKTVAEYLDLSAQCILELCKHDPTSDAQTIQEYEAAFRDLRNASPTFRKTIEIGHVIVTLILEFLKTFYPGVSSRSYETFIGPFSSWLLSVNAPLAVVVADLGTICANPGGAWADLGAGRYGKAVVVHYLDGVGHFGLTTDVRVARILNPKE